MLEVKEEVEDFDFDSRLHLCLSSSLDCNCDPSLLKSTPVAGRTNAQARRSSKGCWTEEEDNLLMETVKKHDGRNWKKIGGYGSTSLAACLPGRTDIQCLHRFQKVLNPDLVKGSWTKEEDDCLVALVRKFGLKRWSFIAKFLQGRIGKQCRERWHNHLDPAIKKDAWTEEEEAILAYYYQIYGSKWAEIAKILPGRYFFDTIMHDFQPAFRPHMLPNMHRYMIPDSLLLSVTVLAFVTSTPPSGCDLSVATPGFYASGIKPAHVLVKIEGQSFNEMDSLKQNHWLKQSVVDNSPTKLIPQYASGEEFCSDKSCFEGGTPRASITPIASSLGISLDMFATNLYCSPLATPVTYEACESPKRKKVSSSDAKFIVGDQSHSPHLSYSKSANPEKKDRVGKGSNHMINSMLPHNADGMSCISPESVLRSLAMTYESIPSIIRKRTPRKTSSADYCDSAAQTPSPGKRVFTY